MKKVVLFAACDPANFKYAVSFWNSMVKFHNPLEIDMLLYTTQLNQDELKKLPSGIKTIDLNPFLKDDSQFFYRQKPLIMESLIKDYECVVGFDVDQIVFGDLSYIWKTTDYDVATVMNYNRIDPKIYGFVEGPGILPVEYFNCGLVACRSAKFIHHWKVLCFSPQFDRLRYREQDLLNILCYYGNYNVRCLDHGDPLGGMLAWWGLISKGELNKAELRGDKIIIPKAEDNFPKKDTELKLVHMGGGNNKNDNWGAYFPTEAMERINYLIGEKK